MTKRERVISTIKGEKVDCIPSGFSIHFSPDKAFGESGIKMHMDFFRQTDMDILKIMNEQLIPYVGHIRTPEDWNIIKTYSVHDNFIELQKDFTKQIQEQVGTDAFILGTLHGVVASGIHAVKAMYGSEGARNLMCNHFRANKGPIMDAFQRLAEAQCLIARQYADLGVNGVYYAALGGEKRYFTDEEFAEFIAPLDQMILKEVKSSSVYSFLHICKDDLNMQRYQGYEKFADVVNWGVYEAPFSLEDGCKLFDGCTIMGGLKNRSGVLVNGSDEEIKAEVKKVVDGFGSKKFILGADCTLPTEISYDRIHSAVMAVR